MEKMKDFDDFEIYIDRLRNNKEERINKIICASLLDLNEKEIKLAEDLKISGKAYITNDFLIINFSTISVKILMPCIICNEMKPLDIKINNFYHNEALDKKNNKSFNFKHVLKEAIFLELPSFFECNNNNCKKRELINKYISKNNNGDK